jgi:hypothetical protein
MVFNGRCPTLLVAGTIAIATGALYPSPAHAEVLTFTCGLTQAEIDLRNKANAIGGGYWEDPGVRFNFSIDTVALTAVALDFPKYKYPARITTSEFSWSLPRDEDDDEPYAATFSLDRATGVLTSTDPEGDKTIWNCTGQ